MSKSNNNQCALIGPIEGDDDYIEEGILKSYSTVQKLGHSSFGVVWKATDKLKRHSVAIKKLYQVKIGLGLEF